MVRRLPRRLRDRVRPPAQKTRLGSWAGKTPHASSSGAQAPRILSLCFRAQAPTPLKSTRPRACAPPQGQPLSETPAQAETRPHPSRLERSLCSYEDPAQPKANKEEGSMVLPQGRRTGRRHSVRKGPARLRAADFQQGRHDHSVQKEWLLQQTLERKATKCKNETGR